MVKAEMGTQVCQPVRVLHVLGRLNMGGAESRIMDLYRHIDRSKVQFDFLVHTEARPADGETTSEALMAARRPDDFDAEIRSLGGRIYALPRFNGRNFAAYRRAAEAFFAAHHDWVLVEGHMTSMASVYLPIAKAAGVPHTAAHVRSAGVDPGIRGAVTRLFRHSLPRRADELYTCSRLAGETVYGARVMASGRVRLIPNAIDTEAYRYDVEVRRAERAALGLPEDALVLGHVGRFDAMKNQTFLVDCLAGLPERFRLLFVGDGALRQKVAEQAAAAGLAGRVIFAGRRSPAGTRRLYQAMDLFVFPSLYEGLPGTVVEAQAAGLDCLIADTITEEVCLTELVSRIPLRPAQAWRDWIMAKAGERSGQKTGASGEEKTLPAERNSGKKIAAPGGSEPFPVEEEVVQKTAAPGGSEPSPAAIRSSCSEGPDFERAERSACAIQKLKEAGYDVSEEARLMQEWYLSKA